MVQVQVGMEGLQLTNGVPADPPPHHPTLPSTLTPAPVTVMRSPGPSLPEQSSGAGGALPAQFSATGSQPLPAQSVVSGFQPPLAQSVATGLLPSQSGVEMAPQQQLNISGQQQQQPSPAAYRMTNAQFSAATTTQAQVHTGVTPHGQSGGLKHSGALTNAVLTSVTAPFQANMHPPAASLSTSALTSSFPMSSYGIAMTTTQQSSVTSTTPPSIPAAAAVPLALSATTSLPAQGPQSTFPSPSVSQTASGLPTLPPSISFPTVAPKISLTPTNFATTTS